VHQIDTLKFILKINYHSKIARLDSGLTSSTFSPLKKSLATEKTQLLSAPKINYVGAPNPSESVTCYPGEAVPLSAKGVLMETPKDSECRNLLKYKLVEILAVIFLSLRTDHSISHLVQYQNGFCISRTKELQA